MNGMTAGMVAVGTFYQRVTAVCRWRIRVVFIAMAIIAGRTGIGAVYKSLGMLVTVLRAILAGKMSFRQGAVILPVVCYRMAYLADAVGRGIIARGQAVIIRKTICSGGIIENNRLGHT